MCFIDLNLHFKWVLFLAIAFILMKIFTIINVTKKINPIRLWSAWIIMFQLITSHSKRGDALFVQVYLG